jgi:hypothetical protein
MGLDNLGLFTSRGVLLGSTKLLDETHGLTLKTTLESSTSTTVDELHELMTIQYALIADPSLIFFVFYI